MATWPTIYGHMAATLEPPISSADAPHALSRDVRRFTGFLSRGAPGPHAHVVLLGLDDFDGPDLLKSVNRGFAYSTFERLQQNIDLSFDDLGVMLDIPRRTLTRRKRDGRFLPAESDRLVRASRLFGHTLALFEGDRRAATAWLKTAQPALGGAVPFDLAKTDLGAGEVERLILRLEHGVFS
jgi:putative toxin-antitoxin system antitoxin component (TIGR02293 family)